MKLTLAVYNTDLPHIQALGLDKHVGGILTTIENMPSHYWPEKSSNQKGLSVLQSMLNEHLKHAFIEQGWASEVVAFTPDNLVAGDERCDFGMVTSEHRLLIEVEFGNGGGLERDLYKFENAYAWGQMDLAILIVPTTALSRKIDSGLTTFSGVQASLARMHPSIFKQPLILLGLDEDPACLVDWSTSGFTAPTELSGTNGRKETLYGAIRQFREGVPVADIGPSHRPSHQRVAKAVSRQMNKPKKIQIGTPSEVVQGTLVF